MVASWFVLNTSIGSLMKWLYLHGEICLNGECTLYKYPLATTTVHTIFSGGLCWCYCVFQEKPFKLLSLERQVAQILPLAACFAVSVGAGNVALKYIYPSFNQMIGSAGPLITVAMASVLLRARYNWWTWCSMLFMCVGLLICVWGEVNFHHLGMFACLISMVTRAARSIITEKLLTDPQDRFDSVTLLLYMSPWATIILLAMSFAAEGSKPFALLFSPLVRWDPRHSTTAAENSGTAYTLGLLGLSGLNACLLNLVNFLVTSHTSAVTLQVLGNVKNCASIGISLVIFGNAITSHQLAGILICLGGVCIYNHYGATLRPEAHKDSAKKRSGV